MSRFQFSIRTLLAAVATVGIGAALWVAEPSWQVGAVEMLLLAWVLGSVTALSVHSTGKVKTFWIGVTSWCISGFAICFALLFSEPIDIDEATMPAFIPVSLELLVCCFWIVNVNVQALLCALGFAPVVGLLCVLTHWLFIRPPHGPQD